MKNKQKISEQEQEFISKNNMPLEIYCKAKLRIIKAILGNKEVKK